MFSGKLPLELRWSATTRSVLRHTTILKMELTSKVAAKHEVEDEETVVIILESITEVDQERVVDLRKRLTNKKGASEGVPYLLKQSPFLDDVGNSLLLYALLLVHVLERIKFFTPLMFDDANLGTGG